MLVLAMQFSRSCALQKNAVVTARCCHAAPADREENRPKAPEGAPVPFLQNGIVMTAEPRLGLPTLETTHRGASVVTNRIASDRRRESAVWPPNVNG